MIKRLKIVEFDDKRWYADCRLKEFRNIYNPHERVSFYAMYEEVI